MKFSKFVMYNVEPMPMLQFIKLLFSHWPIIGDGKLYHIVENMENQIADLLQIYECFNHQITSYILKNRIVPCVIFLDCQNFVRLKMGLKLCPSVDFVLGEKIMIVLMGTDQNFHQTFDLAK